MPKAADPISKIIIKGKTKYQVRYSTLDTATGDRRQLKRRFDRQYEAKEFLDGIQDAERNGDPIKPSKITLAEYLKEWMDVYVRPRLKPTSIAGYQAMIDRYITPEMGTVRLCDLQALAIQKFYNKLAAPVSEGGKGLSHKTIRYVHRTLFPALRRAVTPLHYIKANPCVDLEIPGTETFKPKFLDEGQAQLLLQALAGSEIYVQIILGIFMGMRRGEALGLRWSDIDLEHALLMIVNTRQKVDKEVIEGTPKSATSNRVLNIPQFVVKALREEKKHQAIMAMQLGHDYKKSDYVCRRDDGSLCDPKYFPKLFKAQLKKAGLPPMRFHDLRHTFAGLVAANLKNGSIKKLSSFMGHSSTGITLDLYAHALDSGNKEVANVIDKIMQPKAEKKSTRKGS